MQWPMKIMEAGAKAVKNVSCPKHDFLASFPHRGELGEFVRCLANRILEKNGQRLIDAGAAFVVGDEQRRLEAMNKLGCRGRVWNN